MADPSRALAAPDILVFLFALEGILQELVELFHNGYRFHIKAYRNIFDAFEALCALTVSLLRIILSTDGPWSAAQTEDT